MHKGVFHRFASMDDSLLHFELLLATNDEEYAWGHAFSYVYYIFFGDRSSQHIGESTGYTQKNGAVSKVNKNLFLTLHGHNVHRQQRQLSKFLMRYQQFASHA